MLVNKNNAATHFCSKMFQQKNIAKSIEILLCMESATKNKDLQKWLLLLHHKKIAKVVSFHCFIYTITRANDTLRTFMLRYNFRNIV